MRPPALLLAFLITVCVAVPAQAARVPTHEFHGTLIAAAAGSNESDEKPHLTLLTGEFVAQGTTTGLFTASGTVGASVAAIERLEVFDSGGKAPSTDPGRIISGRGRGPQFFDNVSLTISDNSTLAYYGGDTPQNFTSASSFALVIPLDPPKDLGGLGLGTVTNTSLAVVGPASLSIEPAEHKDSILAFTQPNVNVTVWRGQTPVGNFSGKDWVFRLLGQPRLTLDAEVLLLAFGGDTTATMRPGEGAVVGERLDLDRVAAAYSRAIPNATGGAPILDAQVGEQVRQASAIFNGVLLGNPEGNATLGGRERELSALTLYRFDEIELAPGANRGEIEYAGAGAFVLASDELYSGRASAGPKIFQIPVLSIVLWVLAAGAIVLGVFLKPLVEAGPANASRPVRLAALIFHLVMIPVAFVLWDFETRAFLGTSLLSLGGGGQGVTFAAVAAVQGLSFLLAWTFFGLPIRFLVNSGLKLMNMKRARGVGKGLSYITAWGVGASYYALLLNPFIGLVIGGLGGVQ